MQRKPYRIVIFFQLFLFFTGEAQTNQIDSLKIELEKSNNVTQKLTILEPLTQLLISKSSLEESLPFFEKMAELSDNNNNRLEAKAYRYISETYMKKMDSVNSLHYAKKSFLVNKEKNNLYEYLLGINQIGRVYHHFQYYDKAINTYNEGIAKQTKKLPDSVLTLISKLYSNSSAAFQKLGKTDESVDAILKGVQIAKKTNDINEVSYGLYVLAYNYMGLKDYKKAEEYFLKSLTFSDSVSLQFYININHHGLGINYSRWGKYDKALYHNKVALEFFRKQGDKLYEFDVLNNTAVVFQKTNQLDSTVAYAKSAIKIGKEINHKLAITGANLTLSIGYIGQKKFNLAETILNEVAKDTINPKVIDKNSKASIYSSFSEIYEGQKKFQKSLLFHKKFKTLNDSIQNEIYESKLLDTENKYKLEEKNNKILSQSLAIKEKDEQRNKMWYFISILGVAAFFLLFLLTKRNQTLKEENKKYLNEVKKVQDLERLISENAQSKKNGNDEMERLFIKFLKEKYSLNDALVEFWKFQAHGIKEKDLAEQLNISLNAIKSRRTRLYEKIKEFERIEISTRFSKSDSVRTFREEEMAFFL